MHLDENTLRPIASAFRRAIERADFSEAAVGTEGHLRMHSFPQGACAEATTLLGIYLTEKYEVEPLTEVTAQMQKDGEWLGSHHWLEHDGIIIDITANQFPTVGEPVVVTRVSEFHTKWAKQMYKNSLRFNLADQQDWMVNLYHAIINCI